jgi:hypothetical protein
MNSCTEQKLNRITSYPLLKNAGHPAPDRGVQQVGSWSEAIQFCQTRIWDGCLMMASNALSRFAHQTDWNRGNKWNNIVMEIRPRIDEWLQNTLSPIISTQSLPKVVHDSLRWYSTHICLEAEYQDIVSPVFYLPLVDPWLERGHFPCGWIGQEFPDGWDGKLPNGKLVVY